MTQLNSIETAPIADIANYLEYLKETAGNACGWKTDDEDLYGCVDERAWETWKGLYEKVFSAEISGAIQKRFSDFSWSDPDATYHDDVCAFINAFVEYSKRFRDDRGEELYKSFEDWQAHKND